MEYIFIFRNKIIDKVEIYISAECVEQAQQILNFTVIQPENFVHSVKW